MILQLRGYRDPFNLFSVSVAATDFSHFSAFSNSSVVILLRSLVLSTEVLCKSNTEALLLDMLSPSSAVVS